MGGRALKQINIDTIRVNTKTFNEYYDHISKILKDKLGVESYKTLSYKNKETHGDLDVLLKIDHKFYNKSINLSTWIKENFNTRGIFSNGSVISWEYNNFQIDFIPVKESNWEVAKYFFDYSPMGNLIGKTAHKFGCKYGFEGFVYPFRNFSGRLNENIIISKDPEKIFSFLGFDFERYKMGFDDELDIIKYIISGKYFDSSIFQMENLNSIDRKRNNKRADYQRFIRFINESGIDTHYSFKKKVEYINIINDFFPESNLLKKIKELEIKDKKNKEVSTIFNGKIIMERYPELMGNELGTVLHNFKIYIGEDWKDKFIELGKEKLLILFDEFYNKK